MSFYDDASLVFLAGGAAGKDGKAYSLKPTDGSGDFTFTRGTNLTATRVGKDGYIEKGRENLIIHSNDFSEWGVNTGVYNTPTTGYTGYDGSTNAWLINRISTAVSYVGIPNSPFLSYSGVFTWSIYAKNKSGVNNGILLYTEAGQASFDLTGDGSLISETNTIDTNIESIGSGWFRCSFTASGNINADADGRPRFMVVDTSGSSALGEIYVQNAQLEQGLVATDYIETGATTATAGLLEDEPRFDYTGGGCPALLLEPTRTNYIEQSEYVKDPVGGWDITNYTVTNNAAISPEGVQNAIQADIPSANGYIRNEVSVDGSTDYVWSFYVKAGTATELKYSVYDDTNGANIISQTSYYSQVSTDTWVRIEVPFTTPATCTQASVYFDRDSQGNGTAFFYGAQLEKGSSATSYMPNYGAAATVTRTTDSITQITAPDVNTDAYTFFVHDSHDLDTDSNRGPRMKGASNNALMGYYTNAGDKYFFCYTNNGSGTPAFINYNAGALTEAKYAYVIDNTSNTAKLFLNGSLVKSGTISVAVEADTITFGAGVGSPNRIPQIIYFPTALSNNDSEILTGATSYRSFNVMRSALNYTAYE